MDIYLDFDGTLVEHEYPKIGREVKHAMRVVNRLQEEGHKIILNTMRSEFTNGSLEKAVDWFNFHFEWEMKLDRVSQFKMNPYWEPHKAFDILFIDDQATGIPLMDAVMIPGKIVDWLAVEKILEDHKILKDAGTPHDMGKAM